MQFYCRRNNTTARRIQNSITTSSVSSSSYIRISNAAGAAAGGVCKNNQRLFQSLANCHGNGIANVNVNGTNDYSNNYSNDYSTVAGQWKEWHSSYQPNLHHHYYNYNHIHNQQLRLLATKGNDVDAADETNNDNIDTNKNDNIDTNKNDNIDTNHDNDKESSEEPNTNTESKESLRDTINRLQGNDKTNNSNSSNDNKADEIIDKLANTITSFSSSLSDTWSELINSNTPQDINKKLSDIHNIHPSQPGNTSDDDHNAADKYQGTTAIMIIDEQQNLSAYERIQQRLSEAPLIQSIFKTADQIYTKSGASQAKEQLGNVAEDAREAWDTSQNPWVYRVSSVYDTMTAESETAMAERELRELDPHFSLEEWKRGLAEVTLPNIMQLFLEGRIKELKPFLGEAVYNRLAAESRARKKEGVYIDTNVLGIMNSDILNCVPDTVNKGSPIITIHFMCQQINCTRKKDTGEITEGSEDDIKAYSYVVAMQREYDEEKGELNWKIMDFMLNGAIAYL
jgi:import inner membrane translocase subunit TIM44